MINCNNVDYRENEKSDDVGVVSNTIFRRDKDGKVVEVSVPDDTEEEGE